MNHREDLEFQLEKVNLAIQEVIEDVYVTDKERQERIKKLINFKEAIIYKGRELRIELNAAQIFLVSFIVKSNKGLLLSINK